MYTIHSRSFLVSRDVVFKKDVFSFQYLNTLVTSLFHVLDFFTIPTSEHMPDIPNPVTPPTIAINEEVTAPSDMLVSSDESSPAAFMDALPSGTVHNAPT